MMEWVKCSDRLPGKDLEGHRIVILVNEVAQIAFVMQNDTITLNYDHFMFDIDRGWRSDCRFAIPTHWMPLPEPPKV